MKVDPVHKKMAERAQWLQYPFLQPDHKQTEIRNEEQ